MVNSKKTQVQLDAAHALIDALESSDETEIKHQLMILTESHESDLFHEVGKMTRELHESLTSFSLDPNLVALAHEDIPNTRDRLNYVIVSTEDAANKTLGFIEQTLPLTSTLKETANKIDQSWHRFRLKEMGVDEFRNLSDEISSYLPEVKKHADNIHDNLSEMMMAQEFQDLTGQVLRQVINMIEEVEDKLVGLVKLSGQTQKTETKVVDPIKAEGPQINAENNPNVVHNQDEVDDLLSSLGF